MNLSVQELRELVAALDQTDIAELTFKNSEFELTLRKPSALQSQAMVAAVSSSLAPAAAPVPDQAAVAAPPSVPSAVLEASPAPPPAPTVDPALVEITSPMVGTFYRSPAPDEPPFVDKGDRIQKGQTVCIIEAMKLMNELEAELSGEVVDILVENAEPVEFGQALMRIRPAK